MIRGSKGELIDSLLQTRDGHGGHAFFTPDKAHALVGGGFDPDGIGGDVQRCADLFLHGWSVAHDAGGLGDEGAIDVADEPAPLRSELGTFFQNAQAADAFDAGICGRKIKPDVRQAHGSEDRIGNGMAEHIGIRVALQTMGVRNLNPAQNEGAACFKGVNVISNANASHDISHYSLHANAPEMALGADEKVVFDDGIGGQRALGEVIFRQDAKGFPWLDDHPQTFFILKIQATVRMQE